MRVSRLRRVPTVGGRSVTRRILLVLVAAALITLAICGWLTHTLKELE